MIKNLNVDYLILGQGIAGTLLSYFLLQENKSVLVIDPGLDNSPSAIAAGIVNPITGRRLAKSWMIDELLPFATQTYNELEALFKAKLFYHRPVLRSLFNQKEENEWYTRTAIPSWQQYGGEIADDSNWNAFFNNIFCAVEIRRSLQVNLPLIVKLYRQYLLEKEILIPAHGDYDAIKFNENNISYNNITTKHVICCEGIQAQENPFFNNVPFEPAKGEVLILKIPQLPQTHIIKHKLIFAPLGIDLFWVGSNYKWNPENASPTTKIKNRFLDIINDNLKVPFEIIEHKAAIRPSVKDRRPVLGMHPEQKHLGIFNGLGTKGASLAPYWAHHFMQHLVYGKPIDKEVDINRFSII